MPRWGMGTIDDYLAGLDPQDAAVIAHVYAVAREEVPEAEQGLGYGMPALTLNGKGLISVMRAKKHIGVYPFSGAVVSEFVDAVAKVPGTSSDKGTNRFQPESPWPDGLVRELVRVRRGLIVGA